MKRAILAGLILAGTTIFSGCGLLFVARSQAYGYHSNPTYCYDCHNLSAGVVYSSCNHYEIKVAQGGYYYRPYGHSQHEEFRFAKSHGSDHNNADRADRNNKPEKGIRARR
jgi:hypothetical protein